MEDSPCEAIKNNVFGTWKTAMAAATNGAKKFVMISTDKAVNPTNVMGASKRCCEMIIQYLSQQHDGCTEFVTTRFGNVLGSNGSVIPLFRRQIESGRPVTVTHPDVIRYFMTIPEAVSLVMEAAAIAHGGEIFVLDMGQPVHIVRLAENLIRMYGKKPYDEVEIKFTGLRPGEKLREELLMDEEGLQKTSNELIFIGKQIEIDEMSFAFRLNALRNAALENNEKIAVDALHDMVPTFTTPEAFNSKELKKECRKSVRMKVSDVGLLTKVMEEKGIEYKVIDNSTADVYSSINFSEIAKDFDKVGCSIFTMEEHDESLEAFYLSLLGGGENVQKSVC
jgi:FlaA1/EpsC-like NDP-sugar epimerase